MDQTEEQGAARDRAVEATMERLRRDYPALIDTAQASELLHMNVRTILTMAGDGRLPATRLPGTRKFLFFLEDVIETLRQNMVDPEAEEDA